MIGGFFASGQPAASTRRRIARARSAETAQFSGIRSERDGEHAGLEVVLRDEEPQEVAEELEAAERAVDPRAPEHPPAVPRAELGLVRLHELAGVALVLDLALGERAQDLDQLRVLAVALERVGDPAVEVVRELLLHVDVG